MDQQGTAGYGCADPVFGIRWEGEAKESSEGRARLMEANADAVEVVAFLCGAKVGESLVVGGGAAPACTLRRLS